jgi:hypothetical protein
MPYIPTRRVPSAKGRPDAHVLVPARLAVAVPIASLFPLSLLLNVWVARGVILAGVGVLLWALWRSRALPDPGRELSWTVCFGSLVLAFCMLLTGLTVLAFVPLALFVTLLGQYAVEALTQRRRQHEKRERKARVATHFAKVKAEKHTSRD